MSVDDAAIYEARLELVDFLVEVLWDVPSEEFVGTLLGDEIELPAEPVNEPLDRGFDRLDEFIEANRDRSVEAVQDELRTEYTRLFVGPRPPIHPNETYYRDDTEFIGAGLAEVEASYGAAGWTPPADYGEENDHVAVELAFLRHLVTRQLRGQEETFGYERVFLDEHLLEWIEEFAADLRAEADATLYLAAADVLEGLVEFEDELVAQMVSG